MLWTMAMILFVLWVLGLLSGAPLGIWIHLFLLSALVTALLALAGVARRPGL